MRRLTIITGAPGVGKTVLATRIRDTSADVVICEGDGTDLERVFLKGYRQAFKRTLFNPYKIYTHIVVCCQGKRPRLSKKLRAAFNIFHIHIAKVTK